MSHSEREYVEVTPVRGARPLWKQPLPMVGTLAVVVVTAIAVMLLWPAPAESDARADESAVEPGPSLTPSPSSSSIASTSPEPSDLEPTAEPSSEPSGKPLETAVQQPRRTLLVAGGYNDTPLFAVADSGAVAVVATRSTGSSDNPHGVYTVHTFDASTGAAVASFEAPGGGFVDYLAVSPNGAHVALATWGALAVCSTQEGTCAQATGLVGTVRSLD